MEIECACECENAVCNTEYLDYFPIIDHQISYQEFYKNYLIKNQACLVRNVTQDWLSSKYWIQSGDLNYDYLYQKYGECRISAYNCKEQYFNSHRIQEMKFMEYLVYWESYTQSNYSNHFPLLYLKDWHLRNINDDDHFYEIPMPFASDWLNEYLVECSKDDYRFVYMGPKHSWTPFHSDVFKSYSWSANIFGQKRWLLFPPKAENSLRDNLGNLPFDIDKVKQRTKYFEIIQNAGDAIFVPSGWYHQVSNLQNTISINHNWINACNIKTMWLDLESSLYDVKRELDDCKTMDDFLEQTQIVLKASYGLDFREFFEFIKYIAEKRLANCRETKISNFILGDNHIRFDLLQIRTVLELLKSHKDIELLDIDVNDLLANIDSYLNYIVEIFSDF